MSHRRGLTMWKSIWERCNLQLHVAHVVAETKNSHRVCRSLNSAAGIQGRLGTQAIESCPQAVSRIFNLPRLSRAISKPDGIGLHWTNVADAGRTGRELFFTCRSIVCVLIS